MDQPPIERLGRANPECAQRQPEQTMAADRAGQCYRAARSGVSKHDGLKNLVRAIGNENLIGRYTVERSDTFAEFVCTAIGIPIPFNFAGGFGNRFKPSCGRSKGRLIGVQANGDIDLRRVVTR